MTKKEETPTATDRGSAVNPHRNNCTSDSAEPIAQEVVRRTPQVRFVHYARVLSLAELQEGLETARCFDDDQQLALLLEVVREGEILLSDGSSMPEINAKRLQARLLDPTAQLGNWEERQPGARVPKGARRWLVPGLWPWGTTPLLTGQPKAGKSTLVAELVASLVIPGRKFLGYFEPVTLSRNEANFGVTIISAEGAPEDYERELLRLGVDAGDPDQALVTMFHLEAEQLSFDLTDSKVFDDWLIRLAICDACDGTDDMVPTVIVVDGITAILQNAGKGVEKYAEWIAAFRQLQRALGAPNGLVVGHSTLTGGHSLGNTEGSAQSDGLWGYISANPDSPTAKRSFKVTPRLGGVVIPPTSVVMQEGRLALAMKGSEAEGREASAEAENAPERPDYEALVRDFVRTRFESSGVWPSASDMKAIPGSRPAIREARDRLVTSGELVQLPRPGRGGGVLYAISDLVEQPEGGLE